MTESHSYKSGDIKAFHGLSEADQREVDDVLADALPIGWFWFWDKYGNLRLMTDPIIVGKKPDWE